MTQGALMGSCFGIADPMRMTLRVGPWTRAPWNETVTKGPRQIFLTASTSFPMPPASPLKGDPEPRIGGGSTNRNFNAVIIQPPNKSPAITLGATLPTPSSQTVLNVSVSNRETL